MTEDTPNERLKEANRPNLWVPQAFIIEFSKYVSNPRQKELTIHKLLEKMSERVNNLSEFFRVNLKDVKLVFDILEGEYHTDQKDEDLVGEKTCDEDDVSKPDSNPKQCYNDFVKSKHPDIKKQNPDWSPQEIIVEIGRLWTEQKKTPAIYRKIYNYVHPSPKGGVYVIIDF